MRFDVKKTLDIYNQKGCNVSATCKVVGISRTHFYRMRKENKKFAAGLEDADEMIIDLVESKLMKMINDGNITAIIFFLKSKAKNRGYTEKLEIDNEHKVIDPVQVWIPSNGREIKTKKE